MQQKLRNIPMNGLHYYLQVLSLSILHIAQWPETASLIDPFKLGS